MVMKPIGRAKAVSRKFKTINPSKLALLKMNILKKHTYSKMQWGVGAYNQWRQQRLSDVVNYDVMILEVNLEDLRSLSKRALCHSLCRFIPKVTKVCDGTDYPGKTLYEMITSIQKFLHQNKIFWKLLDEIDFYDVRTVLDNVMKERAEQNVGGCVKQGSYISLDTENILWERGILGDDSPDKLRDTVLFLLGINLGLHVGDEHYNLRRDSVEKASQLTFERAENGQRCLVYREDSVAKTNDGGL